MKAFNYLAQAAEAERRKAALLKRLADAGFGVEGDHVFVPVKRYDEYLKIIIEAA